MLMSTQTEEDIEARRRARLRETDPRKLLGEYKRDLETDELHTPISVDTREASAGGQRTLSISASWRHNPDASPVSQDPMSPHSPTRRGRPDNSAKVDKTFAQARWNVRVYSWGCGKGGLLGNGSERSAPAPVVAPTTNLTTTERVIPGKISCGDSHTLLLTLKGEVFSCGHSPAAGQSVQGPVTKFARVPALQGIDIADVACGEAHSAVVTQGGNMYTWGEPAHGRLGLGSHGPIVRMPKLVPVLARKRVVGVGCGQRHTVAWTHSDEVFSWGSGKAGQLGLGDNRDRNAPVIVRSLLGKGTRFISCGQNHTAVVTSRNELYTFGWGQHGRLGHGDEDMLNTPKKVDDLSRLVKTVVCGAYHTVALTTAGKALTCGWGEFGQLGYRATTRTLVPAIWQR